MTEAEIIELIGIHSANAITSFTVFISFTFGFLATAHFVGARLTSAESIAISLLYCIAVAAAAASQALFHQIIFATLDSAQTPIDNLVLLNEVAWVWGMLLIEFSISIASVYFMWSVRHRKTE